MPAGYSKRPLYQKLGIIEGFIVRIINAPDDYFKSLGEHPKIDLVEDGNNQVDFIHLFSKSVEQFENQFIRLKDEVKKNGMVWVSWSLMVARMLC